MLNYEQELNKTKVLAKDSGSCSTPVTHLLNTC